jgi:hypothetical protein
MNLDEAQKETVVAWVREGLGISEIQSRLGSDLGIHLTYMETRFLLDDLQLKPKDKQRAAGVTTVGQPKGPVSGKPPIGDPADALGSELDEAVDEAGGVSVTVDQVTRAGALVSGGVTFSDGNTAQWYVDQQGRLGLAPKKQGYRPPEEDLLAFQSALRNELAKLGM